MTVRCILRSMAFATAVLVPTGLAGAAAKPAVGTSCTKGGATTLGRGGTVLSCSRNARRRLIWQLPALGSALRPVPLGQVLEAGPNGHRFLVRVTNVERGVTLAQLSQYATPPAPGMTFVRVAVEAVFAGPESAAETEHVWYTADATPTMYSASEGCGGGYGTEFDVQSSVAKGASVTGTHCFTVPEASVAVLRLLVQGYGDRPDTSFALA